MTSSKESFTPLKNNSQKKRVTQRVLVALILSGGIIVTQKLGWLDHFTDQVIKQKIDWSNNNEIISYLKQMITDKQLTKTPMKCLIPVINNDRGDPVFNIEIHEKHNKECPDTATNFPTIFTFRIDRHNGNIQTDKDSPNHFYPLP